MNILLLLLEIQMAQEASTIISIKKGTLDFSSRSGLKGNRFMFLGVQTKFQESSAKGRLQKCFAFDIDNHLIKILSCLLYLYKSHVRMVSGELRDSYCSDPNNK